MSKIKRNSGTAGNVGQISITTNDLFIMNDLAYVFSFHKKIDDLYEKLRLFYLRSKSKTPRDTYTEWSKKNKLDTRLMPLMKHYGFCDNAGAWNFETPPSKADAIFLQLKIRDKYRVDKLKTIKKGD